MEKNKDRRYKRIEGHLGQKIGFILNWKDVEDYLLQYWDTSSFQLK